MRTRELEKYRKKIERAEISCPRCGSSNLWKNGWLIEKAGRKQRWKCKDCAFMFKYD